MANFAQLGIQINSEEAVEGAGNLDKLAAAGARAEKATDKLSKSTTDWAAEQQKANARAREMEAQDARRAASAQKANTAIQDQQRDLAKLLGQIDPTVAALGRLDEAERKLAGFRKSGALDGDAFTEYNAKLQQQRQILGGVSDAQGRAGMSARAYSAAMRNVPAQITDITTSLIGGQPAYLVAIQQGGQLKDMFGGIVPAAKALGSSLLSMINPVTALAAVVGVLGVAWYQAGQRTDRINEALISTGRFAKTSADDIKVLADSIDGLSNVSAGKAITAVTALATTTQLTGDALTSAAAASVQWSAVTGQSVDSVVDKFRAIQKDPLKALTDLNAAEQFLTETQYQRIKALQDEGRWQDAATEAAKIYADVVAGRAQEIQANLGGISVAWQNIKTASSDAWGAVISGADRASEAIGATARRIASMNSLFKQVVTSYAAASPTGLGAFFGVGAPRTPEVIMPGVDGETRGPEGVRNEAQIARAKAAADAWQGVVAATDKTVQNSREIARIWEVGRAAGKSTEDIQKQVDAYTASIAKSSERATTATRSRRVELTEEQRAAQSLAKSYESITAQLERQLALSGDNSQVARINYEISSGNLRGLGQPEQENLRNLAGVADIEADYNAIYSGMDRVTVKAKETTDQVSQFSVQAARNMQTAFAQFLFDPFENGVKGMAKGFADTLRRMAAEAAASQVFKAIGNWATSYTGQGAGWVNAIGGILGNGKAEGGYTGPGGKYQPAGIVHAGEVVWSQRDVAAVGGPRAANSMRPTAGYANGGGPGLPQSRGISQMSAPQITFNMNMQDGTITSQQQGGNADNSTRELKQMFEAMINAWWTKNNRPGGAAYNMRMGTA